MNSKRRTLVITLDPSPEYRFLEASAPVELWMGDKKYESPGDDWSGFYDWLRGKGGPIVGVRFFPFEEGRAVLGAGEKLDYVLVDPGKSVSIFFVDDRGVDETVSDDQHFGGNRVMMDRGGSYALTFDVEDVKLDPKGWAPRFRPAKSERD